jgi:hypothetical protein
MGPDIFNLMLDYGSAVQQFEDVVLKIAGTFGKIADGLHRPLEAVARALGSLVYSVGVSFPVGASISLRWSP